jgi:type III secretion protein HrpB1
MVRTHQNASRPGLALALFAVLGVARPCHADTQLAFRTPPGAVSIPAGQSRLLGMVDVRPFEQIRVVADERVGSAGPIVIRLTLMEGNELVAQLDTLTLAPHSELTKVYDVPGTRLAVYADAMGGGGGSSALDVLVYGHSN